MTKLTDILAEILFEKKLCPKGRAYYNRRKAAGEKSSAYLSGRAVKVCKGLMEEDDLEEGQYDDTSKFDLVKQNPFNIQKLVDKGIIFVGLPGDGEGGIGKHTFPGDSSVITLHNLKALPPDPWMVISAKNPRPTDIPYIQKDQDKLFYNGKYNQILWSIQKKGFKPEDFYLNLNEINFKTLALTALLGLSSVSNTQAKSSPNTTQTIVSPSTTQNNSNLLDKAINKLKKEGYNLDIGVSIDVKKSFLKDIPLDNIKVEFFNANTNAASQLVASEFIRVNKLKPHQTILFHNNEKHALIYVKDNVNESLRDWFEKEDWVRIDTAGNITGPCGTMKKGNATTRCLPRAKANSLTKAERAATSKKKAASDKQFVPNTKKAKVSLNEIEDTKYPYTIYKGDVSKLETEGNGISHFTRDKDAADYYTTSREQQGISKGNKTFEGNIITKNPLIVDANKPSPIELKDKDGNILGIFGQGDYIQKVKDAGYDAIILNRKFGTPLNGWEIVTFDRKQIVPKAVEQPLPTQEVKAEDPTIECKKCGWRWKVSQSDPSDLYICHKCNFDNSYRYNNDLDEYDVENEQDVKEFVQFMREYQQQLSEADCDCLLEAKYQGRTVPLGKPMQGDSKKFKVYVKNPKTGKVVKVNFGFGGTSAKGKRMSIKKNNPVRRKAFRARHNCDNPGPRTKARYWSCRKW